MGVTKYNKDDVMPLVLLVLSLVETDFLKWSMKIAITTDYKDLNGLIDCEDVQDIDFELLKQAEDSRIQLMMNYLTRFEFSINSYTNLFSLEQDTIFNDPRIIGLAKELYWYQNRFSDNDDPNVALQLFLYSIMQILYTLCELVTNGEVNVETNFGMEGSFTRMFDQDWNCYLTTGDPGFMMLANLMKDTYNCHSALKYLL